MLDEVEVCFTIGTVLLSCHHWVGISLMHGIVLASYLVIWLKRCILPSVLREYLSLKYLYTAILLASGCSLGLLSAMTYRIHRGLRAFSLHFIESRSRTLKLRCHMPI